MLPRRFSIIPAYLAALANGALSSRSAKFGEVIRYIVQRSETQRGRKFIRGESEEDGDLIVDVEGIEHTIFYPSEFSRAGFYATVDEALDDHHWHQFVTPETPFVDGETVIDCGCADGIFAARAVEAGCEVIAFEPLPRFRETLGKTFAQDDNIEVLPYAVGHAKAKTGFTDAETGSALSSEGDIEVEVATLDTTLLDRCKKISFIKADIEGYEYDMLLGAENLIRRDRPRIAITVYHQENNVHEMERYLSGLHPDYDFRRRGLSPNGNPVLLYAW